MLRIIEIGDARTCHPLFISEYAPTTMCSYKFSQSNYGASIESCIAAFHNHLHVAGIGKLHTCCYLECGVVSHVSTLELNPDSHLSTWWAC